MKLHKVSALAAVSILAFAACSTTGGSAAPSTAAGASAAAGASGGTGSAQGSAADAAACKNKKGSSSTEIHVYSSLPLGGTNTRADDRHGRADQGDPRRPEGRQLHDQVHQP